MGEEGGVGLSLILWDHAGWLSVSFAAFFFLIIILFFIFSLTNYSSSLFVHWSPISSHCPSIIFIYIYIYI